MSAAFMSNAPSGAATIYRCQERAHAAIKIAKHYDTNCRYELIPARGGGYKVGAFGRNDAFLYWL